MTVREATGTIFDIQHYSIHDGPGIRTTVFLKGCPLKCLWCQNPESQSHQPILFYHRNLCTGCGECQTACPQNAIIIKNGKSSTDRSRCDNCGECTLRCPNDARTMKGEVVSAAEVLKEVKKDAVFFQNSQGGVTISGGDPVGQPDFVYRLGRLCHAEGIHVALETCGYGTWKTIEKIMEPADLVLFDLKHMDSVAHKFCTGVTNESILENAERIYHELKKPMFLRVPIVPGHNASIENMKQVTDYTVTRLGRDVELHLLPYHYLGKDKYTCLETVYGLEDTESPTDDQMQALLGIIKKSGLAGRIGG